jgi:hypothetical protein
MQPNNVLSKAMHVMKPSETEVVLYKLISADQFSATTTTEDDRPVLNNPAKNLAKQTLVRDIETGSKVMIGNVTSLEFKKNQDGSLKEVEITSPPKFKRGIMRLTIDEFATIQYMERHDGNQDNPFRDKKKTPVFFRVNPKKRATENSNRILMLGEALTWVGTCDRIEVKAINSALPPGLKIDMNKDDDVIKSELLSLTEKDPITVMKASTNKKAILKITVMECEHLNIIMFDEEARKWFYNDAKQEDILTIEIGTNRVDGLVDYMKANDEGKKLYNRMALKLKKFLSIGAPN